MLRNLTNLRFLAASLALHSTLILMALPLQSRRNAAPINIPVSILEPVEKAPESPLPQAPKAPPVRANRLPPGQLAKKDVFPAPTRAPAARLPAPKESIPQAQNESPSAPTAPAPPPAPAREIPPERTILAERPLPTLRELLPPVALSSRSSGDGPVSLNTRDPVYVSYFTKIKQLIEANWEYPELALRHGLQGRLSLEFTIGSQGQLERARILRSSGSQLLDDEALRAIKAAAPFPPIPSWIKPNPLSIVAAMEYHDNRVNYQLAR